MCIKCKLIGLTSLVVSLISCGSRGQEAENEGNDVAAFENVPADTIIQEEEELVIREEIAPSLDGVFNDFLFAYLHNHTLRCERTAKPMRMEHSNRSTELLEQFDPAFEFSFLSGDYFTTLYDNASQMQSEDNGELEEDSVCTVQRINLNDKTIRNFEFKREKGKWQLVTIREATFKDDARCDFLNFYANFCSDSLFQAQSIADPLHIIILDSESDEGSIDGIIDADQWQTFCSEVPFGIISNIRREGKNHGQHKVVMRKSGLSNGLQEIFTFTKEKGNWKLTKYEN